MFLNRYRHADCPVEPGVEWDDEWSCRCNDLCPACGAEIEAMDEPSSEGEANLSASVDFIVR